MSRFYMLLEAPRNPKKPVTVSVKNVEEQCEFLQNTWVFLRAYLKKLKTKLIKTPLPFFF